MTTRTKIDVHVGTLSMEFWDTFVKFNIFKALKHPTEDHSIFSIDAIDGLVEDYFQIGTNCANLVNFVDIFDVIHKFCTEAAQVDSEILCHILHFLYFKDFIYDIIHYRIDEVPGKSQYAKFLVAGTSKLGVTRVATLINVEPIPTRRSRLRPIRLTWREPRPTPTEGAEIDSNRQEPAKTDSTNPEGAETDSNMQKPVETNSNNPKEAESVSSSQPEAESDSDKKESQQTEAKVGQLTPSIQEKYVSPQPQTTELKPFPEHLKYTYLGDNQKFPVIITNNLSKEQEEKLLEVFRKHKKAICWTLTDLPGINPSIYMHKILLEEDARLWRLNSSLLDVVKKEVTKLLVVGIIYPISDNQWVSLVQVVPKKSGMMVIKNQQDEMVSAMIQNSWRVCIDYRKPNQATPMDHFPLSFVDQVLEKLAGYMQIHKAPMDQHKTTFTCSFRTFAYTKMSFGLCNSSSTFQRCMINIFLDLLEDCMEVFMDDYTVYIESFEACLDNLSRVLRSSTEPLYELDPEIELTLRRLRKVRKRVVNSSSSSGSFINSNQFPIDNSVSSFSQFAEPGQMEKNDRTLKELATPDVVYQPRCIQYPQLEPAQTYELKSALIHLLPKFHGFVGEDPHKHLKEFHVVCSTMRPQRILEGYIKMKVFPFSLDETAKDWLYLQSFPTRTISARKPESDEELLKMF
ncbi:hypothetical protein CR513_09537, partial [Mucuna pruriens]